MGYTVLWDKGAKMVLTEVHVCYYTAAPPPHVIVVLSGTRVVRVLCVWVATPCSRAARECVGLQTSVLDDD